jgi:hydroxyacylglutathione hydrolase
VSPGLVRLESALWQTSSLLLLDGAHAVAIDPCISADEIEAVRAAAARAGATVESVLVTHADWDHVCGLSAFPDATATMGPSAAARIEDGSALRELGEEGGALGLSWAGEPRCDRVLEPWRAAHVGPFLVETLALPGHTDCGLGYRVRSLGLLAVGDYLSPIECPFVYHSTAAYRSTLATLLEELRRDPPETVVVGHGRPLDAAAAIAIGEADLAYLQRLRAAVAAALAADVPRTQLEAEALALPLPRDVEGDVTAELHRNVALQIEEIAADAR